MVRTFKLTRYPDGTLELLNTALKQSFLKRTFCEQVREGDLFPGATITVFTRQMQVVDYADEGTRLLFEATVCRPFVLVKPEAVGQVAAAVLAALQAPFTVARVKMVQLDRAAAQDFECGPGAAVAVETVAVGSDVGAAAQQWEKIMAEFGPAVFVRVGAPAGDPLFDRAFAQPLPRGGGGGGGACTTCLVKPHAVQAGTHAEILTAVFEAGFTVSALQMFYFNRSAASEFFKVYKGVLVEYPDMLNEVITGPCMFLQLEGANVVEAFREMCGPPDVELGRILRPNSLRARFGTDRVRNAVHCTDLPEDGGIECQYMRHLLSM